MFARYLSMAFAQKFLSFLVFHLVLADKRTSATPWGFTMVAYRPVLCPMFFCLHTSRTACVPVRPSWFHSKLIFFSFSPRLKRPSARLPSAIGLLRTNSPSALG